MNPRSLTPMVLTLLHLGAALGNCHSSSCLGKPLALEYSQANEVYVGQIVHQRVCRSLPFKYPKGWRALTETFTVSSVRPTAAFKGSPRKTTRLLLDRHAMTGERWLLFVSANGVVKSCSNSKRLSPERESRKNKTTNSIANEDLVTDSDCRKFALQEFKAKTRMRSELLH